MAGGQLGCMTESNVNYFRLLLLLINGGKDVLSCLFKSRMTPNMTMDVYLQCNKNTLLGLKKKKKKISQKQWDLLFPVARPDEWDVSLWCLLLGSICGISPPADWNNPPPSGDVSIEADLVRLRLFRNEICHSAEVRVENIRFPNLWKDISEVLLRLINYDHQHRQRLEQTIETYKEGPLPSSSDQRHLLLELKGWQTLDGMEDISCIKTTIKDLKEMIEPLDSKIVQPLDDAFVKMNKKLDKLPTIDQLDSMTDKHNEKWSATVTGMIKDLDRTIKKCRSAFKSIRMHTDPRYSDVDRKLSVFSKMIKGFKKNHVDSMKDLVGLMESQDRLSRTMLHNQEIIMRQQEEDRNRQDEQRKSQDEDRKRQARMETLLLKCLSCVDKQGDVTDERRVRQEAPTGQTGSGIRMDCGHHYGTEDLGDYVDHLLQRGLSSLTCYKGKCGTEWHISELRQKLHWTDDTNMRVETALNRNYFAKSDIKECPSCKSYCTRQNVRDVRVRCLCCSRFEFCWVCLQEWTSNMEHVMCARVNKHDAPPSYLTGWETPIGYFLNVVHYTIHKTFTGDPLEAIPFLENLSTTPASRYN
ncbi:uncharacterized protein [Argopecten irradians]|uniref:uncharacterized protein n=1 Tax=Argopecten irradians TaxID=31199 RepID=UPI00371D80ED